MAHCSVGFVAFGVKLFESSVVCPRINKDRVHNLLETFFSTLLSVANMLASGDSCDLWPNIVAGHDAVKFLGI